MRDILGDIGSAISDYLFSFDPDEAVFLFDLVDDKIGEIIDLIIEASREIERLVEEGS